MAAVTVMTGALVLSVAAPSEAATKRATAVKIASIARVANPGGGDSTIISGDKVVIRGTASASLIGKRLSVQIKKGKSWVAFAGSGRISAAKSFAITSRATGVGVQGYRVLFVGSKTLKPSSASRATTVWQWFPLVDQKVVAENENFGGNAPHVFQQVSVSGVNYPRLLAGSSIGTKTASSDFNLGYHCKRFSTLVGLGDASPSGSTGTFAVYFDGNKVSSQALGLGATSRFDLDSSGFFRVRIENSTTVAPGTGLRSVVTAWPDASILCNAKV